MSAPARFAALVLAAGESKRMGQPKALLDFDGSSALSLATEACARGGAQEVVVVLGAEAKEIARSLPAKGKGASGAPPVRTVLNERHAEGQTSSVKAGLNAVADADLALLVLPVDHPLVEAEDVLALAEACGRDREGARRIFVATHRGRRGHPVLFGRGLRRAILALGDEEPLHRVVRAVPGRVVEVPVRNPFVLLDADSPEDHASLLAAYRGRRSPG
ncbi:MAG: nucleotidyltransferase family protein [Planctomycetota bacterium]